MSVWHTHAVPEEARRGLVRVLTALPEDLGLIPSTHMVANNVYNFSSRGSDVIFWPLRAPGMHVVLRYACRQNKHTLKMKTVN